MLPTTFYGNQKQPFNYLEPQTTIYKWMFGETTIFYMKIWNHPIETTICTWMFGETTIFYIKIWNHPIETTIYNWLFGVLMAKTPMVFLVAKKKGRKNPAKIQVVSAPHGYRPVQPSLNGVHNGNVAVSVRGTQRI